MPGHDHLIFEAADMAVPDEINESTASWLEQVASEEKGVIEEVVYAFCSDDYLLEINHKHLDHDNYTDIITFPYSYKPIQANIFISVDRVKENAQIYNQSYRDELHRVMVHGLLHMLGYDDKQPQDEETMRQKEDYYLDKRGSN